MSDVSGDAAMEWDGQELCGLCRLKSKRDPTIYIKTLTWRKDLANFHREEAEKAWSSLLRSSNPDDAFIINSLISYEANLVACIQSLHSMADILDQIICITLSEDPHKPHKEGMVNDRCVSQKLKKFRDNACIKQIEDSRKELRKSDEFSYINAFCNTFKHRRLINIKAHSGNILIQEMNPIVDHFDYNDKNYPAKLGSEIFEKYSIQIYRLIIKVALDINEYLKNI
jgi:hypothetical protein